MLERPEPELHGAGERAGASAGPAGSQPAHVGNPLLELGQEQLIGHRDRELQPLHGFRPFIGGFELRIHPLLAEKAGAILGDAVTSHEADGLAHHGGAVAGVPEFARRTKNVGQRVEFDKLNHRVGFQFLRPFQVAFADRTGSLLNQFQRFLLFGSQFLERRASRQFFIREPPVFLFFQRIQYVEQTRRRKTQRCARLAGGPDVHEPMQGVLLLLDAQFVTRRAGRAFAPAEPAALIKNHRLNGRKQFGGGHQADRDPGAAKNRFDDFAVRIIRNDDAVLDGVTPDDAVRGHFQIEYGIVRGGKLVDEFLRRRAPVPDARVALLQNHHATALERKIF